MCNISTEGVKLRAVDGFALIRKKRFLAALAFEVFSFVATNLQKVKCGYF